ncbi:THO complex subunit 2-like, partial [Trifolium medium]|nr:THO complex subunit 2-like [Trifolium medium]
MQPSWVTEEEFGMGFLELKPAPSMTKSAAVQSGIGPHVSQTESASGKHMDSGNTVKDQTVRTKTADGRTESITAAKSDSGHVKLKGSSMVNGLDAQSSLPSPAGQSGALKSAENPKQVEESISRAPDEHVTRNVELLIASAYCLSGGKGNWENTCDLDESRTSVKRSVATGSVLKPSKQDPLKEDGRSGKTVTRTSGSSSNDKDLQTHASDGRHTGTNVSSSVSANGNIVSGSAKGLAPSAKNAFDGSGNESKAEVGATKSSMVKDDGNDIADFTRGSSSRVVHSPRHENTATSKSSDKIQKRAGSVDELDRLGKRRKGDVDLRDLEGEVRFSEREKLMDPRLADDKVGPDELGL